MSKSPTTRQESLDLPLLKPAAVTSVTTESETQKRLAESELQNTPALQKIRRMRKHPRRLMYDLYQNTKDEIYAPFRQLKETKYPNFNFEQESMENWPKDYLTEISKTERKVNEFLEEKSDEQILADAISAYEFYREKNYLGALNHAYELAQKYLDQPRVLEVGQGIYTLLCEKMRKTEEERERFAAAEQLTRVVDIPEIDRGPEILEEAFGILFDHEYYQKNPRVFFDRLKTVGKKWGLPKNERIKRFGNTLAHQEILQLLKHGKKEAALKRTEFYHDLGFLDLNAPSDFELFEMVTST